MMDEQIRQKLFGLYLDELEKRIEYDNYFHVDVEHQTEECLWVLMSTLYAEQGNLLGFDYDLPPERENTNIQVLSFSLEKVFDESRLILNDEETLSIILPAIKKYAKWQS